jgi:hypothetical protein
VSAFTKEELALGARMFDLQPDSPWTAFCELCGLFGSMSLERRQELYDIVAKQRAAPPHGAPIQRGFEYEVRLAVSIPLAWATLLKESSKHHYDYKCRATGDHGTINGLYNTACNGEWPSTLAVSWSDLDLTTKVAEQLEHHTTDHTLIREIRAWLRSTMDAITRQRAACMELLGGRYTSPSRKEVL